MSQPLHGYGYDHPAVTLGEQQAGDLSNVDDIDVHGHKKPSIFGKLKDKTRRAGSRIKSKVGKKNTNADGTTTTVDDDGEEDEEEDDTSTSDDSPSPVAPASPAVNLTPYTGPASVPREFGTYPSPEPSRFGNSDSRGADSTPCMSGLSLHETPNYTPESTSFNQDNEPAGYGCGQSSTTEKALETSEGEKDTLYGGAAATAGALGYDAAFRDDSEERSITERSSEASSDLGSRGYNAAGDAKDTVAEKGSEIADQTEEAFSSSTGHHSATDAAYETKDAAESKAADLNNATDDSETYTEKASIAAFNAKDTIADTLGMNQPSEEPSSVDKVKESTGSAANTAMDYATSAKDTAAEAFSSEPSSTSPDHSVTDAAYETKDAVVSKAVDLNNSTNDSETYTEKAGNAAIAAKDTVANTLGMNQPSEGPSVVDKAKDTLGSAVDTTKAFMFTATDTTKDTTGSAVDTTKEYATSAKDTTADYVQGATDATKDYATKAKNITVDAATPKQEDKALSEKITEALSGFTMSTQSPKSPTAHDEAAAPGILGKITGLFGFGQKAPEDHTHAAAAPLSDTTYTH